MHLHVPTGETSQLPPIVRPSDLSITEPHLSVDPDRVAKVASNLRDFCKVNKLDLEGVKVAMKLVGIDPEQIAPDSLGEEVS